MTLSTAEPTAEDRLSDQEWQASDTTSTLPARATLTAAIAYLRQFRFPFNGRVLVVEIFGDSPAWVEPTVQSLGKLLQLEPGWDTYGGLPIDPKCVVAALNLVFDILPDDIPAPSVVPTSRGGVQIEWHIRSIDLEVEFISETRLSGLFEDPNTNESWEKDLSSDLHPLVDAISTLCRRH